MSRMCTMPCLPTLIETTSRSRVLPSNFFLEIFNFFIAFLIVIFDKPRFFFVLWLWTGFSRNLLWKKESMWCRTNTRNKKYIETWREIDKQRETQKNRRLEITPIIQFNSLIKSLRNWWNIRCLISCLWIFCYSILTNLFVEI